MLLLLCFFKLIKHVLLAQERGTLITLLNDIVGLCEEGFFIFLSSLFIQVTILQGEVSPTFVHLKIEALHHFCESKATGPEQLIVLSINALDLSANLISKKLSLMEEFFNLPCFIREHV